MSDILQLAAQGDAQNVMRDMRVRSLYSPYYFTKVVLGYNELSPSLHQHDSELFIKRWIQGQRKQWIQWSRGFFKTTQFTIGTSTWVPLPCTEDDTTYALEVLHINEQDWFDRMALHNQDITQLLAFETITNAKKKVGEIRWHFEENELFRALFPEIAFDGTEAPWNNDCLKIRRATDKGKRVEEGTFEAIGVGVALQSRHYDIVWEDDLVGKKAIESETEMEKTIRWHELLHGAFVDATNQTRFGVSNRWGYNDLNSYIQKHEDFVFYSRSAWEFDPEQGCDVSIFPERYSIEGLKRIQSKMNKYDFSCQYLNVPILPGEQEVSLENLHTYTVSEEGEIICSCGSRFKPSQLLRTMHYDPYNAKGIRSKSCPAIVVVGTSIDHHIVLLDYFTAKGSYGAIYSKLYDLNDRWRPYKFSYEDVGHQNMTEFHIRQMEKFPEHLEKHKRLPVIVPSPTKNKANELRIREFLLPVFTRYKFTRRSTHLTFTDQLETFPNATLDHDYDLLVALAQGAAMPWRFPDSEDTTTSNKSAEDEYIAQLGKPYSHQVVVA
jgi:hypothetical protein